MKQLVAALVVISSYNEASYFPNIIFMDEQPKIVKRRRARSIESKTESDMANESSFALPDSDVEPAELAEVE